jgi:hypothetical protein
MVEAASTFETSVKFRQTTLRNKPEDSHLYAHIASSLFSYTKHFSRNKKNSYVFFYGIYIFDQ